MKVLVVIDMQNDFVDGALGTPEAARVLPRVRAKVAACLEQGGKVVYTKDTHGADYLQTQEGKLLPVAHCVKGTEGWEFAPGVYAEGCPVVEKAAFGSPELAELVARLEGAESVELVGVCTDVCVISNALLLKAFLPEMPVSVDASCCAGVTPESHRNALHAMRMCQVRVTEGG